MSIPRNQRGNGKKTVYEIVTERILEKMKQGKIPWHQPWKGLELPKNLSTKRPYRGINIFSLILTDFSSPYWVTFKQASQLGGRIKKGSKGSLVVFWNWKEKEVEDQNGEIKIKKFPILRYYLVFNVEQTEGLERYIPQEKKLDFTPIEQAERIAKGYKTCPEIKHETQRAFYRPSQDFINLPKKESFDSIEEYYSTLFHELTHSTGHEKRLNRKGISEIDHFGSQQYSKEELTAELGCAYLCGIVGIENKTINNSIAYLQNWIGRLQDDPKLLIRAASQAQKAVDYILGANSKEGTEPAEDQIQLAIAA
ncbi:MAG: DUF1738 domain-containing protein [Chlamydiae bacterium]|nr:DUF1738 domain-containing protein [Chlamydiota bacterium]